MNYERCQNGCQFRLPKEITPNLEKKKKKKKKGFGEKKFIKVTKLCATCKLSHLMAP